MNAPSDLLALMANLRDSILHCSATDRERSEMADDFDSIAEHLARPSLSAQAVGDGLTVRQRAAVVAAMENAEHDSGDFDDTDEDEANARDLYEGLQKLLSLSQPIEPQGAVVVTDELVRRGVAAYEAMPRATSYLSERIRAALEAALPVAVGAGEWLPIESAPKDGTNVLLVHVSEDSPNNVTQGYWVDAEDDGMDYMGADAGFVDVHYHVFYRGRSFGQPAFQGSGHQPTHWMPLPPAPAAMTPATPAGKG